MNAEYSEKEEQAKKAALEAAYNKDKENNMGMDLSGLAQLVDTVRAGQGGFFNGGGGEGGGRGGGFAPYAGPAAIRADILSNRAMADTGIENIQRAQSDTTMSHQISTGDNRICDKLSSMEMRSSDQLYALARDIDNKFVNVTEQNHQIALSMKDQEIRNVERYCDLKAGHATLEAKLDSNQKFNELFAENQSLKTQVACGCGCDNGHGHHGRG